MSRRGHEAARPVTRSDIAEIIDPAAEIAYRQQLGREMYEQGRRDADAAMAERWAEIAKPAVPFGQPRRDGGTPMGSGWPGALR